jgi:hypothetical protein
MVVGGQYTSSGQLQQYSGDGYFQFAVVGLVVALVCQLFRQLGAYFISGLASVWTALMMVAGVAHLNSQVGSPQTGGVLAIRWEIGLWIALGAIAAAILIVAYAFIDPFLPRSRPSSPPIRLQPRRKPLRGQKLSSALPDCAGRDR